MISIKNKADWIILGLLFVASMYLWGLPLQSSTIPFSETDGASHFALSDYMYTHDKIIDNFPYYRANNGVMYAPILYPPEFFVNGAVSQTILNDRFVPFFAFLVITSTAIIFTTYLLMRKLYGTWIAAGTSLLLLFSGLDIYTHIMGQWTILIALAGIPAALYCVHQYVETKKPVYLYLLPFIFLTIFSHPQAMGHIGLALLFFSIFACVKAKKFVFDWKHLIITGIICILFLGPFAYRMYAATKFVTAEDEDMTDPLYQTSWSSLTKFYGDNITTDAYPKDMFDLGKMLGPFIWFAGIGIIACLWKRRNSDLLLLSWALALYLILHSDLFNVMLATKIGRSMIDIPHIMFPLMVVGWFTFCSFAKSLKIQDWVWKSVAIIILLLFTIPTQGAYAYKLLKDAYPAGARMTQDEFDASLWLYNNTNEKDHIAVGIIPSYTLIKWMGSVAQRNVYDYKQEEFFKKVFPDFNLQYFMYDNTFIKNSAVDENIKPLYYKGNVKIYKTTVYQADVK